MSEELKPCPFCGSKQSFFNQDFNRIIHILECFIKEDTILNIKEDNKFKKAWNTRTKEAKLPNPANPPAFPSPYLQDDPIGSPGMTLRDWFAGQALIGRLSRAYFQVDAKGFEEKLAKQCSAIADAMLAERAKYDQRH